MNPLVASRGDRVVTPSGRSGVILFIGDSIVDILFDLALVPKRVASAELAKYHLV